MSSIALAMQTPRSMAAHVRAGDRVVRIDGPVRYVPSRTARRAAMRLGTAGWGELEISGEVAMRGVRVLEVGGSSAGAYCGHLFATVGADVVVVEPPDGAPTRRLGPWVERRRGHVAQRDARVPRRREALRRARRRAPSTTPSAGPTSSSRAATAIRPRRGTVHDRVVAADPATVHVVLSGFGLTGPTRRGVRARSSTGRRAGTCT